MQYYFSIVSCSDFGRESHTDDIVEVVPDLSNFSTVELAKQKVMFWLENQYPQGHFVNINEHIRKQGVHDIGHCVQKNANPQLYKLKSLRIIGKLKPGEEDIYIATHDGRDKYILSATTGRKAFLKLRREVKKDISFTSNETEEGFELDSDNKELKGVYEFRQGEIIN